MGSQATGGFGGNSTFGRKPGGTGRNPSMTSGAKGYKGGGNFWDFNPRAIAGLNPMMRQAARGVPGLATAGRQYYNNASNLAGQLAGPSQYYNQAIDAARSGVGAMPGAFREAQNLTGALRGTAGRRVTGAGLETDPAILAAQERFNKARLPMIQNMASQMGLGKSNTVANAAALAQSNELLPLIQEGLAREERGIGREMSGIERSIQNAMSRGGAELGVRQGDLQNLLTALTGAAGDERTGLSTALQTQLGLGQQEAAQYGSAIQAANQMGTQLRGVEQEQLDAPYQEQQRLWAEALNAMYGPLGMIGSLGGATSTTSKK